MRRNLIGIVALLSLLGAIAFWIWPPSGVWVEVQSGCWRLGALLAVIWLAFYDLQRVPLWVAGLVAVMVIILVRWPKAFLTVLLVLIPALILVAILRPRIRRSS